MSMVVSLLDMKCKHKLFGEKKIHHLRVRACLATQSTTQFMHAERSTLKFRCKTLTY